MQEAATAAVLVVDDDTSFRTFIRMTIEASGFSVVGEAANRAEALRFAAELGPDVITMDLEMPVLDGAAATAELCKNGCPPIVIVSGSDSSEQIGAALQGTSRDMTSQTSSRS